MINKDCYWEGMGYIRGMSREDGIFNIVGGVLGSLEVGREF